MNKKLYLLFNHTLTPDQVCDAKKSMGINEFISMPNDLQSLWENIPTDKNLDLIKYLTPIVDYFKTQNRQDYVLIQGDFGAIFYMVSELKELGYRLIYSTTERKIIEEKLQDNTIETKRIFKHVCFREYV